MSGAWVAGLFAIFLAAAGEPDGIGHADDPAEDVAPAAATAKDAADEEEEEDTAVAVVEPALVLPPAPRGLPLADSAPVVLQRIERPDGTALERVVEPSGDVVLHEVTRAGTVLSCRTVGALLTMRVVEQRHAARGEVVQVARDTSGAVLRYVIGADGEPRAVTLVSPAAR